MDSIESSSKRRRIEQNPNILPVNVFEDESSSSSSNDQMEEHAEMEPMRTGGGDTLPENVFADESRNDRDEENAEVEPMQAEVLIEQGAAGPEQVEVAPDQAEMLFDEAAIPPPEGFRDDDAEDEELRHLVADEEDAEEPIVARLVNYSVTDSDDSGGEEEPGTGAGG